MEIEMPVASYKLVVTRGFVHSFGAAPFRVVHTVYRCLVRTAISCDWMSPWPVALLWTAMFLVNTPR